MYLCIKIETLIFYKTSLLKAVYINWVLFGPRIYCLSLPLKLMVIVLNADSGVQAKIIKKFEASPKNIHFLNKRHDENVRGPCFLL